LRVDSQIDLSTPAGLAGNELALTGDAKQAEQLERTAIADRQLNRILSELP